MSMRTLAIAVLVPTVTYQIGQGAILPVIAVTALDLHSSVKMAALMLSLLGIGQLIGDIPASALANRVGDRKAMLIASALAVAGMAGCLVSPTLPMFAICLTAIGAANAIYNLGRQSYLTDVVPPTQRARMMSSVGGFARIGQFIGPLLSAVAITAIGLRAAYAVGILAALGSALLLVLLPDVPHTVGQSTPGRDQVTTRAVFVAKRRMFATLGTAVFAVGAVRATRQTVLPLWAHHIGASPAATSVIFGISSGADMLLFYPAGKIMDEFGRLSVALTSMLALALAMIVMPLAGTVTPLVIVAIVMGIGNGIGSGILATLGADTAPAEGRAKFLGLWRFVGDGGNAAGPVAVSVLAGVWSLGVAIALSGSTALFAALGMAIWVPKYSKFATRSAIRAAAAEGVQSASLPSAHRGEVIDETG
jgi:MFS family permease